MLIAGSYQKFTNFLKSNTPSHTKSKGFDDTLEILIHLDGTVTMSHDHDVYFTHFIVMWVAWGLLGTI